VSMPVQVTKPNAPHLCIWEIALVQTEVVGPCIFCFLTSSHFTCVLGYICCHRDVMVIIRLPHCYSLIESYIVKYYLSSICAGWWRIIWKFHKRTGWYLVLSCKACKSKFSSSLHILGMCVITSTFNLELQSHNLFCFSKVIDHGHGDH
jgi:hypothetical protein